MNSSSRALTACEVVDAGKLPTESGGQAALCEAIEKAAKEIAPSHPFKVQVRVLGSARLSATITTADGKVLPEQNYAITGRDLNRSALERFAKSLAAEVARSYGG